MAQLGENCIWCGGSAADSDVSHVLPECFGNRSEQVLPKGIVCRSCNNYFGSKVEPALDKDPVIRAICVGLRVVDAGDGKVFRDRLSDQDQTPSVPPVRTMDLTLDVSLNALELDVSFDEVPRTIRKEYDRRGIAGFSRAIHKLAFESFVWHQMQPDPKPARLDIFAECFEPIKQWARFGRPTGKIRPLVRAPEARIALGWETRFWGFEEGLAMEWRLFGDWLAISLTSSHAQVQQHLVKWCSASPRSAWMMSDAFAPL